MSGRLFSGAMAAERADETWDRVRRAKPLVHCITNYVSMDIMANTLLAVGASPAMVRLHAVVMHTPASPSCCAA